MFVIRDPLNQFKKDNIEISISSGAQIAFTENAGHWEKIII